MRDTAYLTSVDLAKERGAFPLFNAELYLSGGNFASRLSNEVKAEIRKHEVDAPFYAIEFNFNLLPEQKDLPKADINRPRLAA